MKFRKIRNLLDNTPNEPSKFRMKNSVEINDDSRGMYSTNSQIKFKSSMLKSSLCGYSDSYILVRRTISDANTVAAGEDANNNHKEVVFKKRATCTDCISEINNTQIDNARATDVLMRMYNLIEYSDNYLRTSGSLWQYCRHEPPLTDTSVIVDIFPGNSVSFKFRQKIIGRTDNNGTKHVYIMVSLKSLSSFSRTIKTSSINREINLILILFYLSL